MENLLYAFDLEKENLKQFKIYIVCTIDKLVNCSCNPQVNDMIHKPIDYIFHVYSLLNIFNLISTYLQRIFFK